MKITSLVTALPPVSPTGWGNASKHINAELKKLAFVQDLNEVNDGLLLKQDFPVDFTVPVLQAVQGVNMLPMYPHFSSPHRVGYSFIEDNLLLKKYEKNFKSNWDWVCVGSSWAKKTMKDAIDGDIKVTRAIQGVDTKVFLPMEYVKTDPAWFTIFSGGKFEYRKGQDVVISAAKVMMQRHADVRLVVNWWNPWPQSAQTMGASTLIQGGVFNGFTTALENGIPVDRIREIGQCTHEELCRFMNQCDVALFPNRAEAGTNLVLMEAMACGLPVIATNAHGHMDVLPTGMPDRFAIEAERFIYKRSVVSVGEWYEPNLDQVIEALEYAYKSRDLDKIGEANRAYISQFTWERTAQCLLEACEV